MGKLAGSLRQKEQFGQSGKPLTKGQWGWGGGVGRQWGHPETDKFWGLERGSCQERSGSPHITVSTHSMGWLGPVQPALHGVMKKAGRGLLPESVPLAQGPVPPLQLHSLPPVCLRHTTNLGKQEHRTRKGTKTLAEVEVLIPKL